MSKISIHFPLHLIEHICRFLPIDEYQILFPINMEISICNKCINRVSQKTNNLLEEKYGVFYLDDFSDWNQDVDEYMSFPLYMDYIIYRKDQFIKKTLKHLLQRSICEYFYISQIPFYLLESNECFYESFNNKNMKKKIFHTLSEKYIDCIDKWTYDEFCYKCKSFDCRNSKHYV